MQEGNGWQKMGGAVGWVLAGQGGAGVMISDQVSGKKGGSGGPSLVYYFKFLQETEATGDTHIYIIKYYNE